MICVPNSDQQIWNKDNVILDIIAQVITRPPRIDITLNDEGPCAQSLGLYTLLDNICQRHNYPGENIYIHTCNLVETHTKYNIVCKPQTKYLDVARTVATPTTQKKFDSKFKHFGNFIGHGNRLRLRTASYLYQNYQSKTTQTYHCDVQSQYHRPFFGLEDLMFYKYSSADVQSGVDLINHAPLTIDTIDEYPILSPATFNITKVYPKFFVDIVNQTYYSGSTFYIDEKIWRPILMKTPFIVQGPQNFITHFKRLGFKTFDTWWSEGYSEDINDYQLKGIIDIIDVLATLTVTQLESIYAEMAPVLEHNYQLMLEIPDTDFLKCRN